MCKAHVGNILTFFVHRLTNGPIEGLNNKIQGLIKKAFGYRNKERFKYGHLFPLGWIGPLSRPMKKHRNIPEEAHLSCELIAA